MKIDEKSQLFKTVELELEIATKQNAINLIKKLSRKESTVGDIKKDLESIKPYEGYKNMSLFITAHKALEIIEQLTDDIGIETILKDIELKQCV